MERLGDALKRQALIYFSVMIFIQFLGCMGHLPASRVRGSANTTHLFDTGKSQVENAVIRIIQILLFHLFRTSVLQDWAINILQVILFVHGSRIHNFQYSTY